MEIGKKLEASAGVCFVHVVNAQPCCRDCKVPLEEMQSSPKEHLDLHLSSNLEPCEAERKYQHLTIIL